MHIYKTTNLINGLIYVGQNKNGNKTYLGSGDKIRAAIAKYGRKNFKKEIIEECCDLKTLNEREIYWIAKLKSTDRSIGYNIDQGGSNNPRIGESNGMFGRKHSPETLEKIRLKAIGRNHSKSSRLKMSEQRKGKTTWNKGIPTSEEVKFKLSLIAKNQIVSDETKEKLRILATGRKHTQETKDKIALSRRKNKESK